MTDLTDRPMAATPFKSYRYRGRYGWIMIGAMDDDEAFDRRSGHARKFAALVKYVVDT